MSQTFDQADARRESIAEACPAIDALLEPYRNYYARARRRWREVLQQGIGDGSVRADLDVEAQADILVGVVDGLSMQALLEGLPAGRISQTLETHLSTLRPPILTEAKSTLGAR